MTTAQKIYSEITTNDKYASVRWIANVLMTGCGKAATRLRGLKNMVDGGHEVHAAQFKMPYECLVIDGQHVVAMPALDAAAKGKTNLIGYTADWYKH